MTLTPITADIGAYPAELQPFLRGAKLYDSSCSSDARVIFIDKGEGAFLKSAPKGSLERETAMTRYFHSKELAGEVIAYLSDERDWLLTPKIRGADCTVAKYLARPEKLCDTLAEQLAALHGLDCADCPVPNHTELYLAKAGLHYRAGIYDTDLFPDNWGYASAEEAWRVVEAKGPMLRTDTLLHGDYCLPNIILDEWRLGGFVDLDIGGVGDRHVDVFWAIWTLFFNLKTNKYRERFIDAYGRGTVDEDMLRVVAAVEVFG
ncbi:MAG: aminoglycoside 3'-phosphotransferase [Clostridiales Family XIII bacterium]|jgi:kanamycin kinase|nr:aminoglycoside 3'-phosphotransferase [Clostridiales Family XIII bacterium]